MSILSCGEHVNQTLRRFVPVVELPTKTPVLQGDALPVRDSRPRCRARVGATKNRERSGVVSDLPRPLQPNLAIS